MKKIKKQKRNIKQLRVNKTKAKKIITAMIPALIIIIVMIILPSSFSRYSSTGTSSVAVDIAFALVTPGEMNNTIALKEILPDDTYSTYTFSISNEDKDGNRIDVNMKYKVTIKTTTNLPMIYELYDEKGTKLTTTNETKKDVSGTYFNTFTTNWYKMSFKTTATYYYTIKYKLPSSYDAEIYQNQIELVDVIIDSEEDI